MTEENVEYLIEEIAKAENQGWTTSLLPDIRDAMFEHAARLIVETQQGSTSLIQRKLNIGYSRA